jgi:hypothetical protein
LFHFIYSKYLYRIDGSIGEQKLQVQIYQTLQPLPRKSVLFHFHEVTLQIRQLNERRSNGQMSRICQLTERLFVYLKNYLSYVAYGGSTGKMICQ